MNACLNKDTPNMGNLFGRNGWSKREGYLSLFFRSIFGMFVVVFPCLCCSSLLLTASFCISCFSALGFLFLAFHCFCVNPLSFLAFAASCAFFLAWFVFPAVSPGWHYFVGEVFFFITKASLRRRRQLSCVWRTK